MKTILLPIDFSIASEGVFQKGLDVLRNRGEDMKVLLLNTFRGPFTPPNRSVAIHDELKKKALDRLAKEREKLKGGISANGIDIELLAIMGSLDNVVSYLIQERQVDCLVLGADFSAQKEEIVKILSRATCPVLIIPSLRSDPSFS